MASAASSQLLVTILFRRSLGAGLFEYRVLSDLRGRRLDGLTTTASVVVKQTLLAASDAVPEL